MLVGIETEAAPFFFLEYLFQIFGIVSLQCFGKNYKWSFPNMLGDCGNLWLASHATLPRVLII
jgi:hypothetical protein